MESSGKRRKRRRERIVVELLRPKRGGFMRSFGCGWFIREYLLGNGPYHSPQIDPKMGAPQSDIFYQYKNALMREIALNDATKEEERRAKKENRPISPESIERLADRYLEHLPYKTCGCNYHSFVVYFSTLQRLGWVEFTGREEPSAFQDHYPAGNSRRYFRLTQKGREAPENAWRNPHAALYGSR
jgi:hypothetical protein